ALLVLWVRAKVGEPETWKAAKAKAASGEGRQLGSFPELWGNPRWRRNAVLFGRRRTFVLYHLAALVIVPLTCFAPTTYGMLLAFLPFYGFVTVGIHAGYAVYFPELFPNHLRSTGAG